MEGGSIIPRLSRRNLEQAYIDVPIIFTNEEISVIPALRQFIAVMIAYAIRGIEFDFSAVNHEPYYWRKDIVIPYYKKFIGNSWTVYLMERVLEKQFWNLKKRHSKLSKKQIVNFILHDIYADVISMPSNKIDIDISKTPPHKVFRAYYSPLYPFPNINLRKWTADPNINIRLENIRGYYEGGKHWHGHRRLR